MTVDEFFDKHFSNIKKDGWSIHKLPILKNPPPIEISIDVGDLGIPSEIKLNPRIYRRYLTDDWES